MPPDASDPLGFFSVVADKLLRSTFSFGVTNIPVYVNGQFVYTPSVNRLLQLAANVYDAGNTNYFPVVFRPCFGRIGNDVFITGYEWVYSSVQLDFPLAQTPMDITDPRVGTIAGINVFGIPWIIGAKKGLPNFNQLALVNTVTVTRKLQVIRDSLNIFPANFPANYVTNQMYAMSIGNSLGISFWNSYNNSYPRPLTIYAADWLNVTLTNAAASWKSMFKFDLPPTVIPAWPGSQWSGLPPNTTPNTASFFATNWNFTFLAPSVYHFATATFDPVNSPTAQQWDPLYPLPQFTLLSTNYLQAIILDGTNVIDYVQLKGISSGGNLNSALADPNYPDAFNQRYQWSTNQLAGTAPNWGILNQIMVSMDPMLSSALYGNYWVPPSATAQAGGFIFPAAESAYFKGFFTKTFQYNGVNYINSDLTVQVPYTPSRTIYNTYLLQANDPLVHYLASDLASQPGNSAIWRNGTWKNGYWYHSDDPAIEPLPQIPSTSVKGRYQPWGQKWQMASAPNVDTNAYNCLFRDPIVWNSDNWNFPSNLLFSLNGLGQVHRGTPWQTIYLKSGDILTEGPFPGNGQQNIGTNTWMQWTGDLDPADAGLMAPTKDWHLASLLATLLGTNDATQLFPVNDPNINDWLNLFNGMVVYSNSTTRPYSNHAPEFDTYQIVSNSLPAGVVASAIQQAQSKWPIPHGADAGDILATPELTIHSPWLNTNGIQLVYGISDATYEGIPSQLLPLLRPDSTGRWLATNGGWILQFSGSDALTYEVQSSADLVSWQSIGTNQPVQGLFNLPYAPLSPSGFYRTRLVP